MQPAAVPNDRVSDLASTVVATMRQLGIVGLPRNYEIFYEALTGTNHDLSLAVVSLPKRPTQQELDVVGRKFFAHHHGHSIVDSARKVIASELEDIAALLRDERMQLEKYGQILNQTSDGLENRNAPSADFLNKILKVMSVATTSTLEHQRQTVSTLGDKSAELESVKSKLEEYKRLVDTDSLTLIANRRAFDRELTKIYDSQAGVLFKSLVLADIDGFKAINDRFGHPTGDKIIQMIAGAIRSATRNDVFVARTGGEEFAAIVEGATEDMTYEIAERIRLAIAQTSFASQLGADHGTITMSLGMCMASEAESPDDLYAKADKALYRSKMAGRNRVTRHSGLNDGKLLKNWLLYKKD
jgi:diguanylate cyclase